MNEHLPIIVSRDYGTDLSSRFQGGDLRGHIEQAVLESGLAEIDLDGVETLSHSFADEVFAVLVEQHGEQWFKEHVRLLNLSPFVRGSILESIQERLQAV